MTELRWQESLESGARPYYLYETEEDGMSSMRVVAMLRTWGDEPHLEAKYWIRGVTGDDYVAVPDTLRTLEEMKAWILVIWRMR